MSDGSILGGVIEMLYRRDIAADCRWLPLKRQDQGGGVFWWDSGCGVEDGAGIGVWGCGMVVFVGFWGMFGRGI